MKKINDIFFLFSIIGALFVVFYMACLGISTI